MKTSYDAVVIGSGFGGAITAFRLAQAGQRVAILEQGRRWSPGDFPRTVGQTGDAFWAGAAQRLGFLEYRAFKNIDVIQGVGVGGGSLHYFNVGLRAPARVLARWPKPLSREQLDPYYDLVQARLESKTLTPPPGRALPPRTEAFLAAARGAGATPALTNIAVHTAGERRNRAGVAQAACTYCGNCMLGCQAQSKNTLDITYIAEAERTYGVEVFPLHRVESIRPANGSSEGYDVAFQVLTDDRRTATATGTVHGKRVVIAAGTLGSNELLLRCRDRLRMLPRLSRRLGQRFSGNGDFLFAGAMATRAPIDPAQGPSITAVADCSTDEHSIHIEDLGYPDPMLWFLEGALPPGPNRLVAYAKLAVRYVARSLGLGGRNSRVADGIGDLLRGGRTNHFLPYLGMGSDAADGVLALRDDEIDVRWSHRGSRAMFREMEAAMRRISQQTGGEYVTSFLWRWPWRKLVTAHPLGGCAMGDSEADSVVNHAGEVWNYPGLFVTDGASIPSALSVNPSLTIGAVAERAAFWILHGRDRRLSDPD
jgi:cholesterol oxidase